MKDGKISYVTGKAAFKQGGKSKSPVNAKFYGKPVNTNTPSGGGAKPLSSMQTSGKVARSRTGVNKAGSDGGLSGMPTVHITGSQTTTIEKPSKKMVKMPMAK